jgi:hypothetical protein
VINTLRILQTTDLINKGGKTDMAHFASLDENNIVTQVIVVANEDTTDTNGVEVEEIGVAFCKKLLGAETNWKQTSYNNNFRVRYAGIGYSYNAELNAFIAPKPFESWVLVEETADWESPEGPAPELTEAQVEARSFYRWDEEELEWVLETQNQHLKKLKSNSQTPQGVFS